MDAAINPLVTESKLLPADQPAVIGAIHAPIEKLLQRVNEKIRDLANDPLARANGMSDRLSHVLSIPGKRLRPSITLLASRLWGHAPGEDVMAMAVAVELLHIATLIHDDTVDRADLRRGHATAASLWGTEIALVLGDYVFATAARFVCQTKNLQVITRFADNSCELARGELVELLDIGNDDVTRNAYERRIFDKTASLFRTAAEGGAVLGRANEDGVKRLVTYGYNIGMAYQVVDDILDFESTSEMLGKPAGHDLAGGVLTLPTILLKERSPDSPALAALARSARPVKPGVLADVVQEVRSSGVLEEAHQTADVYIRTAVNALDRFPPSPELEALLAMAQFVAERNY